MKQQLEQLLKDAEEVTAKMREALAQMDKPWIPKKGDWAEVISVDDEDIEEGIKVGDIVKVDENDTNTPFCILPNCEQWIMLPNQLRHLPNYNPKPALAATYSEIVEAVKPRLVCDVNGDITDYGVYNYALPDKQAFEQDKAYIQIKNLEAYCAENFEGNKDCTIDVDDAGNLLYYDSVYGSIKVSFKAAEWLIANHPEPFLVFFGVKS